MTKRNTKEPLPGRDIIPDRLEKARSDKGYSRPELGRLVGTNGQTIEKIEKGENKSSAYLLLISKQLNVSPEWLTGLIDKEVPNDKTRQEINDLLRKVSEEDLPKIYQLIKGICDLSSKIDR